MSRIAVIVLAMAALMFTACEQPTGPEVAVAEAPEPEPVEPEPEGPAPSQNRAPTVELADVTITVGSPLTIEADGYDPDGDDLAYEWSGAVTMLGNPAEWTPDAEGEYTVHVACSDGEYTAEASATVTVEPQPWTPEPLHVYILDANDEVYLWEECTEDNYYSRLRAYQYSVELWNRDGYPGSPFTAVGGGTL